MGLFGRPRTLPHAGPRTEATPPPPSPSLQRWPWADALMSDSDDDDDLDWGILNIDAPQEPADCPALDAPGPPNGVAPPADPAPAPAPPAPAPLAPAPPPRPTAAPSLGPEGPEAPPDQPPPKKRKRAKDAAAGSARRRAGAAFGQSIRLTNTDDADLSQPKCLNLDREEGEAAVHLPLTLNPYLKAHQLEGIRFLWTNAVRQPNPQLRGCVLAHSMGLGKTMQTVMFIYMFLRHAPAPRDGLEERRHSPFQVLDASAIEGIRGLAGESSSIYSCIQIYKALTPPARPSVSRRDGRTWASILCEYIRREKGGGLDPKICVPKMAQINLSFCKFHFFPL